MSAIAFLTERRKTAVSTGVSLPVLVLLAAAAVFLIVGSLVSSVFAQQTVAGLSQGAIFGSLALALVLIYRATEVINFAQGEMAMATTYVAYQLTLWGLSYWAAFFLTLAIAFVLGVAVQLVFIRPIQQSVIAVVIVTIGMFILIDGLVTWKWGADLKFMKAPFGNTVYHAGGVAFSRQDIGVLLVSILSVILLWVLFQFTVTREGRVKDIVILDAQPKGIWDRNTIRAASNWRYQPALKDGKPVETTGLKVKHIFELER